VEILCTIVSDDQSISIREPPGIMMYVYRIRPDEIAVPVDLNYTPADVNAWTIATYIVDQRDKVAILQHISMVPDTVTAIHPLVDNLSVHVNKTGPSFFPSPVERVSPRAFVCFVDGHPSSIVARRSVPGHRVLQLLVF
jgi:hypothetical protein